MRGMEIPKKPLDFRLKAFRLSSHVIPMVGKNGGPDENRT